MSTRTLAIATSCWLLAGCFGNNDDAASSTTGSGQWLACGSDGDCGGAGHCDAQGYCIDDSGARVRKLVGSGGSQAGSEGTDAGGTGGTGGGGGAGDGSAGSAGAAGSAGDGGTGGGGSAGSAGSAGSGAAGTGGASGTGGAGGGSAGNGSAGSSSGVVLPDCSGISDGVGTSCIKPNDQPVYECCSGSTHLRCEIDTCLPSAPDQCSGQWQPVAGSDLCGGYQPCEGKSCGDACSVCDPNDTSCVESSVLKACDASGQCVAGSVDCTPPESCDPFAIDDTCGPDMACCEVGRCGPLGTTQGICEPADPVTGGCTPCACDQQPGGCPICNSPDTPIATPNGERAIAELVEGDLVLSVDGGEVVTVPIVRTGQVLVFDHAVVRLTLDNGRSIEVSGSHPTADGRRLDELAPGDTLGDVGVVSVETIRYEHDRTYDILPASDTGTYLAGGVWLGSTLRAR